MIAPAAALAVVTGGGKLVSGRVAARPLGVGRRGRLRAGTALVARGEFSIVIASLGIGTDHGAELGALAAAYVLLTAVAGPVAAKYADRLPLPGQRASTPAPAPAPAPAASSDGHGLS